MSIYMINGKEWYKGWTITEIRKPPGDKVVFASQRRPSAYLAERDTYAIVHDSKAILKRKLLELNNDIFKTKRQGAK